jgi:hypothetical protein
MEIAKQIEEALAKGQVVLIPVPSPQDRNEASLVAALCQLYQLRRSGARVLAKLVTQDFISKSDVFAAVRQSEQTMPDGTVNVLIHRLRQKLFPHGVEVRTMRGIGYAFCKGSREKVIWQLAEHDAGRVSITSPVQQQPSL